MFEFREAMDLVRGAQVPTNVMLDLLETYLEDIEDGVMVTHAIDSLKDRVADAELENKEDDNEDFIS